MNSQNGDAVNSNRKVICQGRNVRLTLVPLTSLLADCCCKALQQTVAARGFLALGGIAYFGPYPPLPLEVRALEVGPLKPS